jgi:hypothetical protein
LPFITLDRCIGDGAFKLGIVDEAFGGAGNAVIVNGSNYAHNHADGEITFRARYFADREIGVIRVVLDTIDEHAAKPGDGALRNDTGPADAAAVTTTAARRCHAHNDRK